MDVDALIDRLAVEGELLLTAARRVGWNAAVPALDWDVRALVTHTGGVHRWATAVISRLPQDDVDLAYRAVGEAVPDGGLAEWYTSGLSALVAALRAAPDDLDVFTFLPAPSPKHFWARRQAHETAMHRGDVEAAGGPVTACDVDFSQDGIAEVVQGFAARRRSAIPRSGVLALAATDVGASWRLTFGGEMTIAERGEPDGADTTVTGSSFEIYRWLWNRPADVMVTGDQELAELWASTVQVRW